MEYPMEVSKIKMPDFPVSTPLMGAIGDYVAIKPVGEECKKKTFLGILLGEFPVSTIVTYRPSTKEMTIFQRTNPAIFVPDLNKVVFGYESWWGKIKDKDHLREITDEDIQNIWYVKALKQLQAHEEK